MTWMNRNVMIAKYGPGDGGAGNKVKTVMWIIVLLALISSC